MGQKYLVLFGLRRINRSANLSRNANVQLLPDVWGKYEYEKSRRVQDREQFGKTEQLKGGRVNMIFKIGIVVSLIGAVVLLIGVFLSWLGIMLM